MKRTGIYGVKDLPEQGRENESDTKKKECKQDHWEPDHRIRGTGENHHCKILIASADYIDTAWEKHACAQNQAEDKEDRQEAPDFGEYLAKLEQLFGG
jgi:hypothetical protein